MRKARATVSSSRRRDMNENCSVNDVERTLDAEDETDFDHKNETHSLVVTDSNTGGKRNWDNEYVCVFCGTKMKGKLPRHLERHHMDELDVARAFS